MKKIIWIDLDEVLSETVDGVLKFHNYQINGKLANRKDISSYYLWDIKKFKLTKEEWIKYFKSFLDSKDRENILPVQGAKAWLEKLIKIWWKIAIITARRIEIKDFTIQRLNKYFLWMRNEIVFANHFSQNEKNKSELCKQQWIKIMIEDNLEYAKELSEKGIKVYLLAKPWNKKYKNGMDPNIIKVAWREEIII